MIKVNLNAVTNLVALNYLVGKCEGVDIVIETFGEQAKHFRDLVFPDGSKPDQRAIDAVTASLTPKLHIRGKYVSYQEPLPKYCTDSNAYTEIMFREGITLSKTTYGFWEAYYYASTGKQSYYCDAAPVVCLMKSYIERTIGETVEIPEELMI